MWWRGLENCGKGLVAYPAPSPLHWLKAETARARRRLHPVLFQKVEGFGCSTSLEQHISNWPKSLSLPCPAPAGVPEKTSWAIAFQNILEVQPLNRVGITTHRKTPGQRFSLCPVAERWHGREAQALPICQGSNHYQLNPEGLTRFHFNPRLKYPKKCLIRIDKM